MATGDVVRTITIRGMPDGIDPTTAAVNKLSDAMANVAVVSDTTAKSTTSVQTALDRQQRSLDATYRSQQQLSQAMVQAKSVNDNLANGYKVANDNAEQFGKGIASHAEDFLNNVNHLKLMAVAAYAMSPAFRSFTNTEVSDGLKLIGVNMGLVSAAAKNVVTFASPALSFFARMAIPIGLAVAAWEGFNYVINLGSDILKKYTDAERSLFASSVNDDLTKLTKFQSDTISSQQVQYATDLAARLKEAKSTISDFFSVQLDLTQPALQLQGAWVSIVETLAKGVDLLNNVADVAKYIGNLPVWNLMNFGWHMPGALTPDQVIQPTQAPDNSAALAIAKQNLAGGMGSTGTFANRFSQDITALANPPKPDASTANAARDAWDRATAAIDKHASTMAADTIAVGQSAATQEQLRAEFSLLEAAKLSDRDVTDQQIAKYTEYRASMTATQALQAAGIKWDADEKAAFDRTTESIKMRADAMEKAKIGETISRGQQTAFLTSEDVQIANQLKTIYPNVATAMNSVEASGLRMNQAVSSTSQAISGGLTTALTDVAMGTKTAAKSFQDFSLIAIGAIEKMIIQLMIVGPLMRSLQSGLGGIFPGLGIGATATASPLTSVSGGAGLGFMVPTAHTGGVLGTDALASRYIHQAYFDNAPRFGSGGIVSGEVPIVAHKGEGVFTPGQMAAMGGSSIQNTFHISVASDATSSDPQAAATTARAIRREMEGLVNSTIMKQMRPGGILRPN